MTAVTPEAVAAAAFTAYWDSLGKTYCGSSDGESRAFAAGWAAAAPHIRAAIYAELGSDHYVIFTEDGWTTEHSVDCRLSGHMHECSIHAAIGEWAQDDPPVPGRWRVVSADGPVPALERAERGDPQ